MSEMIENDIIKGLEPIAGSPVAAAHAIAAIALNMSLKYHDIATVQDGTLYQQYKLEGKNFQALHLDSVFETAILMEAHLMGASDRIAKLVIDCVKDAIIEIEDDENAGDTGEASTVPNGER
jgi:hypothetical protein